MVSNSQKPKAIKGNQYTGKMVMDSGVDNQKSKTKTIQDLGFNQKQAERFETLAVLPRRLAFTSLFYTFFGIG